MRRLTVEMSDDINARLHDIAQRNRITIGAAIFRALALLSVADQEKDKGNTLAIVDANMRPVARVVGVF